MAVIRHHKLCLLPTWKAHKSNKNLQKEMQVSKSFGDNQDVEVKFRDWYEL